MRRREFPDREALRTQLNTILSRAADNLAQSSLNVGELFDAFLDQLEQAQITSVDLEYRVEPGMTLQRDPEILSDKFLTARVKAREGHKPSRYLVWFEVNQSAEEESSDLLMVFMPIEDKDSVR